MSVWAEGYGNGCVRAHASRLGVMLYPMWVDGTTSAGPTRSLQSQARERHIAIGATGDPYGTRTRVFAVRGRRPRPLDEGAISRNFPGRRPYVCWNVSSQRPDTVSFRGRAR